MKLKLFLSLFFFASFFLVSSTQVSADCDIASWRENSRTMNVCVGEFNSVAALRGATANVNCLDNSNLVGGACSGITGPSSWSLSGTPDSQISQDAAGKYYTCFDIQGINRAIGKVNVSFSGTTSCVTADQVTQPADWDFLTEGLPWQAGTTEPVKAGSIDCPDEKSINTALGCISYDAESGGFVRSLLGVLIGLGGGVALLLILYGVFTITTSAGIPDKLNQGKEIISSAVAGLVFIILSIFLMNLIGISILAIPGLE